MIIYLGIEEKSRENSYSFVVTNFSPSLLQFLCSDGTRHRNVYFVCDGAIKKLRATFYCLGAISCVSLNIIFINIYFFFVKRKDTPAFLRLYLIAFFGILL